MNPTPADPLTVVDVLTKATNYFEQRGVESPRLSAEVLLGHVLGVSRLQVYLQHDRPLQAGEVEAYRALIRRRGNHEPVAYLTGNREFFSLDFEVTPDVLIPRPETEHVVEAVLAHCKREPIDEPRIVDLGTGSGCIAIGTLTAMPGARAVGVDVSAAALAVAKRNAERHGVAPRLALIEGDMEDPSLFAGDQRFTVVVSNPPYITEREAPSLPPDVARYEPRGALFCGDDAVRFYRAVTRVASRHLTAGGLLCMELGQGRRTEVEALLQSDDWGAIDVITDLQGIERVLVARKSSGFS